MLMFMSETEFRGSELQSSLTTYTLNSLKKYKFYSIAMLFIPGDGSSLKSPVSSGKSGDGIAVFK